MKSIGLSYMAYWGDQFEDIASGNNFFLADLVLGLEERGYKIYSLQKDLDNSSPLFKNFLVEARKRAYKLLNFTHEFPDLDILLVEWRWKMAGRNWNGPDSRSSTPMDDYYRQDEILSYYHMMKPDTKIFILDSDHKMTEDDIQKWSRATILSFDLFSKHPQAKYVYWPFDSQRLISRSYTVHAPWSMRNENTYCVDPNFFLSYIGNNYERDEEFKYWLGSVSKIMNSIHVYGNWMKYPAKAIEIKRQYPNITFHPKVTKAEMEYIYSRSLAVPLLAKDEYNKYGHMTHRLLEAMYCGTIPIGFASFRGIEKYLIPELVARSPEDFFDKLLSLSKQTLEQRKNLWHKQVEHFQYGPSDFINILEES